MVWVGRHFKAHPVPPPSMSRDLSLPQVAPSLWLPNDGEQKYFKKQLLANLQGRPHGLVNIVPKFFGLVSSWENMNCYPRS